MKYSRSIPNNGRLQSVEIYEGESIEEKVARIVQTKEPITDTMPIIYTEKKDGVLPAYNIRTDRFDLAIDAFDKIEMERIAKKNQITADDVPLKLEGGSPSEN
jgi:uncharacterized protein YjgD (DUF1641 family)